MESKYGHSICFRRLCLCNVSYIGKAQRGISDLLRTACEEAKLGNSTVQQQVHDIGGKFLNAVEISA